MTNSVIVLPCSFGLWGGVGVCDLGDLINLRGSLLKMDEFWKPCSSIFSLFCYAISPDYLWVTECRLKAFCAKS